LLEEGVDGLMVNNSDFVGHFGQLSLGSALVFLCVLSVTHLFGVVPLGLVQDITGLLGISMLLLSLRDFVHELHLSRLFL